MADDNLLTVLRDSRYIGQEGMRQRAADEIERMRADKELLIDLVLDNTLTPAVKNLVAIAIRDGGPPPTEEALAWCSRVIERVLAPNEQNVGSTK